MANVEYTIVSYESAEDTAGEVARLLNDGWDLQGDLKVTSGATGTIFSQAMLKREYYGGIDQSLLIHIEDIDEIKYAVKDIAEAIETLAKSLTEKPTE